jgi:hypothetical protein
MRQVSAYRSRDWDGAHGYRNELFTIQSRDNFWYLKNNFEDFDGAYNHKEDTRRVDTVEAVKSFFVGIGQELAALSVDGIDKVSLEPILKKALGVSESSLDSDYEEGSATDPKTRAIFLVENYKPATEEADAIGVFTVDWYLKIKNY